ncbi:hypothetical protein [Nocardia amamiensis]|uniref:hypothetical protein n=1 Tax=Nocardia amamiensis TaxID=404578 RepID=UPI00083174DB|nr:hypothetical protein [Nocardia amamiensis]
MLIYRAFDTDHVYYATTVGAIRAGWRREGRRVAVMSLDDSDRDEPARRWPDEPLDLPRGHIAFGPDPYPTLDEVRELLPQYDVLWDAVTEEYRESLSAPRTPDGASVQHARFFDIPG